jgi:putative transposase
MAACPSKSRMARPLRILFPGALYHITVRGNEKKPIFRDDTDRYHFLRLLAKTIERFGWLCYSYCLMDNHFHLLIETPLPNLSEGMKILNGSFTQFFNWRHIRVGHLFQGRFHAILVEKNSYLLELCRYIPLNAVRAGMCPEAGDYRWSSYRAMMGQAPIPPFLQANFVLGLFGSDLNSARGHFQRFVREGIDARPLDNVRVRIFLGSDTFILKHLDGQVPPKGIPRLQAKLYRPDLGTLLKSPDGLRQAHEKEGYSLREIGTALRLHPATVGRRLQQNQT